MKSLITVLGLLAFGSVSASASDNITFAKFSPIQEEFVNPFDNGSRHFIEDTIRRDGQINEMVILEIYSPEYQAELEIERGVKITEAVSPAYQPLDWAVISQGPKVMKTVSLTKANL